MGNSKVSARTCQTIGFSLCVVVFGGCMVGPDFVRPGLNRQSQPYYTTKSAPALFAQFGPLESDWWAEFNDPVLHSLILQAVEQNLELKEAYHRIAESRYQLLVVRGSRWDGSADAQYRNRKVSSAGSAFSLTNSTSFDFYNPSLDATWQLDLWGKIKRQIEAAEAEVAMNQEDYHGVMLTLLSDIATNYIQYCTTRERIGIAQENLELQGKSVELTKLRLSSGLAPELDVAQAESNYFTTKSQIPQLETELYHTQNRLCVLLGQAPFELEPVLALTSGIPHADAAINVGIPANLILRRPDLRRAERNAQAENAKIGVALAELLPQITLTGNVGVESRSVANLFTQAGLAYSVGPSVSWNVFNLRRIRNAANAQQERYAAAVLQFEQTFLEAVEEVENSMVAYEKEIQRSGSLREAVRAAENSVAHSQSRYARGLINFQSVLDSERQLLDLQGQLASSLGGVSQNMISIYKSVGGGWQ